MDQLLMLGLALDQRDAWRDVALMCGLDPAVHLGATGQLRRESPGSRLIDELVIREWRLEDLQECLKELHLDMALSYISQRERLQIIQQPYSDPVDDCFWEDKTLYVKAGGTLCLKIKAVGSPLPSYKWFRDNIALPEGPVLMIKNFSKEHNGQYCCLIQQIQDYGLRKEIFSDEISVKVAFHKAPCILHENLSEKHELESGEDLFAFVHIAPGPKPTYVWRHHGKVLEGCSSNELRISGVNEKHAGLYECRIKNRYGEIFMEFNLEVKKKGPYPSEKMALIIANSNYDMYPELHTPNNDAKSLEKCLKEYGFTSSAWFDQDAASMNDRIRDFFKQLKKGAYVLFYFAGHGEMANNLKFLVGCDANPERVEPTHYISENILLEGVKNAEPLLFISILDMCQKSRSGFAIQVQQSDLQWNCDAYQCYATSQNRVALEPTQSFKNSVYMTHLLDGLRNKRDAAFIEMIREVHENVRRAQQEREQVPQVNDLAGRRYKLSDPVKADNKM